MEVITKYVTKLFIQIFEPNSSHLVIAQLVERLTVVGFRASIGHWFDSGSRDSFNHFVSVFGHFISVPLQYEHFISI